MEQGTRRDLPTPKNKKFISMRIVQGRGIDFRLLSRTSRTFTFVKRLGIWVMY